MGLLSSLALVLTPLLRSGDMLPPKRKDELEEAYRERIEELRRERDEARADADRWEAIANRWQARYEQAINPILEREIQAQARYHAMLMAAHAQSQNAQMNAQMAMQQMMNARNFYQEGQVIAVPQGYLEGFCNCVPARHDMFLGGHGA